MSKHKLNFLLTLILFLMVFAVLCSRISTVKYSAKKHIGSTEQAVREWMTENKIKDDSVIFGYAYSELPEGTVIHQNISENGLFSSKNALVLTVSDGEDPNRRIELIDFTGMDQKQIENWLKQQNLTEYSFESEINESVEEGLYLHSDPPPGSRVTRSEKITFIICEHDHSTTVILPDFTGKTIEDVSTWAENNEIITSFYYYYDDSPAGSFLFCDLPAGAEIEKRSYLAFAISSGTGQ